MSLQISLRCLWIAFVGLFLVIGTATSGCSDSITARQSTITNPKVNLTYGVQALGTNQEVQQSVVTAKDHESNALAFLTEGIDILTSTTKPSTQIIQEATPKIQAATVEVKASNTDLAVALGKLDLLTAQLQENQKTVASLTSTNDKLGDSVSTLTKEKQDALSKASVADAKYNDHWFGGKFWRAVWWTVGISTVLGIVLLLLNFHTDLFVWPVRIIGWLFTPK